MISAKIIADSIWQGKRITSLRLTMPRFILAQFNTHRQFSRSTSSNRAVPTAKLLEQIGEAPAYPIHWGANQPGMQAREEIQAARVAESIWSSAALHATECTERLLELGVHKQVANRLLEPFLTAHTIVTATEWGNFFRLRLHDDAQPEIQELARHMKQAMEGSIPVRTPYHLPYIRPEDCQHSSVTADSFYPTLAPISAARCARVSYLNHDGSNPDFVADRRLAAKLCAAGHWSALEHQAHGADDPSQPCRNFIGWVQYRSVLDDQ